MRFVKHNGFTR